MILVLCVTGWGVDPKLYSFCFCLLFLVIWRIHFSIQEVCSVICFIIRHYCLTTGRLIGFACSSFALLARDKMHKTHSGHYYFINSRGGKHWDICNMLFQNLHWVGLFHEGWVQYSRKVTNWNEQVESCAIKQTKVGFSMLAKIIRQAWRVGIFMKGDRLDTQCTYAICGWQL